MCSRAAASPICLQAVRTAGFLGANVTHPFKEEIIALLDEVSVEAAQIGAVNTVAIDPSGRTTGYNTDRVGFGRAFLEMLGREVGWRKSRRSSSEQAAPVVPSRLR